jgi:hypothetical protein
MTEDEAKTKMRRLVKFAWMPKRTTDGWVWLRWYYTQIFLDAHGNVAGWIISKEPFTGLAGRP